MKSKLEYQILEYLGFQASTGATALWRLPEGVLARGLAFTDTAGLTLHLLAKLKKQADFTKLPASIQERLERNFRDNSARTNAAVQEFIQFNRLLQAQGIRYLNLKGLVLYPDFVDFPENRFQYDHDFLIGQEDLPRAYDLFLGLGYSPLSSSGKLAVGHLPTLIKRTGWIWKGDIYDPAIPRAIELHFQLWEPDFDLIPIRSLDKVWQDASLASFQSLSVPVLSREHTLLYCALHCFRHLLRNDLRLSHLYELAFFLEHHPSDEDFWKQFLASIAHCRWSLRGMATMFELACQVFTVSPAQRIQQFIDDHLSPAGDLWIRQYGKRESIHCYRRSKLTIFLHLDFVPDPSLRWAVIRQKIIPTHFPWPSFGVQVSPEEQGLRFRMLKGLHYGRQLLQRFCFHFTSLIKLLVQLPEWYFRLQRHMKETRVKIPSREGQKA
ncbi:MAG: hypothetical protein DMG06_21620 [Acidobacteria bacterium]|nr:MAG: hypothetical protein DMG06_21620 [Acidobacteriota bacterium]